MPKKKAQRNGLYWFMQDLVADLRKDGTAPPNGIANVVPIALPRWKVSYEREIERRPESMMIGDIIIHG